MNNIKTEEYSNIRNEIKSGDILLCSGTALFSKLIQKATNSIWSHVGFILRIDILDRIMVLESVENIGVRTVPLTHYLSNYNGTSNPYPGELMISRHNQIEKIDIKMLSKNSIDFLGYPYDKNEIAKITARLMGYSSKWENNDKAFICSEYVDKCYKSIGINIQKKGSDFVTPNDFFCDENIKHLYKLKIHSNDYIK